MGRESGGCGNSRALDVEQTGEIKPKDGLSGFLLERVNGTIR